MARLWKSMRCISAEKYRLMVAMLRREFNVPEKKRTQFQRNVAKLVSRQRRFLSLNRKDQLLFRGKKIITTEDLPFYIKQTFRDNHGCGARVIFHKLKEKFAGFSEKDITDTVFKKSYYQRQFPIFDNKPEPKVVISHSPGQRWQIDLIDMKSDLVEEQGKSFSFILQVVDVFSRYIMPRALNNKTSESVAEALEDIIFEHGPPKIIQCDNGTEFKGPAMKRLICKYHIKLVHGRPYHPQSQGKCERVNRTLKQKIRCSTANAEGFNWVSELKSVSHSINTSVHKSLGYYTPFQLYFGRCHTSSEPMTFSQRKQMIKKVKNIEKKYGQSLCNKSSRSYYRKGESVYIRFPLSKSRVPTKRRVLKGTVLKNDKNNTRYLVQYSMLNGNVVKKWVDVQNITSLTRHLERSRRQKHETKKAERLRKKQHKMKYYCLMSHEDRLSEFCFYGDRVKIAFDPKADGNCQFSAISHQLGRFGIYMDAKNLRSESVKHLRQNEIFYVNYVNDDFHTYLDNMSQDRFYGDNLTLLSLARELNMQCAVISAAGPDHCALVSNDGTYDWNMLTIVLGHFPEGYGTHYVSLQADTSFIMDLFDQEDLSSAQEKSSNESQTSSPEQYCTPKLYHTNCKAKQSKLTVSNKDTWESDTSDPESETGTTQTRANETMTHSSESDTTDRESETGTLHTTANATITQSSQSDETDRESETGTKHTTANATITQSSQSDETDRESETGTKHTTANATITQSSQSDETDRKSETGTLHTTANATITQSSQSDETDRESETGTKHTTANATITHCSKSDTSHPESETGTLHTTANATMTHYPESDTTDPESETGTTHTTANVTMTQSSQSDTSDPESETGTLHTTANATMTHYPESDTTDPESETGTTHTTANVTMTQSSQSDTSDPESETGTLHTTANATMTHYPESDTKDLESETGTTHTTANVTMTHCMKSDTSDPGSETGTLHTTANATMTHYPESDTSDPESETRITHTTAKATTHSTDANEPGFFSDKLRPLSHQDQLMKLKRLVEGQRDKRKRKFVFENLPLCVQVQIVKYCVFSNPSSRFVMNKIGVLQNVMNIGGIHPPQLYISPNVMKNVPPTISVRRLVCKLGRNSGAVCSVKTIINDPRWINAWLHLKFCGFGWFEITDIWYRTGY